MQGDGNAILSTEHRPAVARLCASIPANAPYRGTLRADSDDPGLRFELLTPPAKGTATIDANGDYVYTPRREVRGLDTFAARAVDAAGQPSHVTAISLLIDGALRIMPLGDSITEGLIAGVANDHYVGYRRQLYANLENPRYGIQFVGGITTDGALARPPLVCRDHEGRSGWCDDNEPYCEVSAGQALDAHVIEFLDANPADIVLLHIGTNHFDVNARGVERILNRISEWAQVNYPVSVFVARIIPSVDGSLDVNTFNDNVQAIAGNRPGVRVYMVDQQSQLAVPGNPNRADPSLMSNNLHPNQAGYDRMGNKWWADLVVARVLPTCP